ncbi:helix-turn-helix domain-containing protein [Micromonospora chersina]|uniref:helix-turn-helix domain-containing protein n=1 Tax=Micromonospora chersina TaxID=47854 RepID=UPI0037B2E0EC
MKTAVERRIPDAAAEPTISVKRAADVLGISTRSAHAAAERGELPSIRVGRRVVVPTARFLAKYSDLLPEQTPAA